MGPTLEVVDSEGDYNDPLNWRASTFNGGTPGSSSMRMAMGSAIPMNCWPGPTRSIQVPTSTGLWTAPKSRQARIR